MKPTMQGLPKLSEADIKRSCESFLYSLMNMGKLLYFRLNSGNILIGEGEAKRMFKGCPKGTSDGLVVIPNQKLGRCIFIEYKSPTGKQTRYQVVFEKQVEGQGHEYWLVSDTNAFIEAMREVLK